MSERNTKPLEELAEQTQQDVVDPWHLILYNDNVHTFDEVILQLIKALQCDVATAEEITLRVHNEGKCLVHSGTIEECLRINGILLEINLNTEIRG
jgi:ATP-dependent Clp protease adapter protein ClpS